MASTNKTPYLGLNCWLGTDKPTRMDFIHDNIILDNQVGVHIEDKDIHFNYEEKKRFNNPFFFKVLQGDDEETRTVEVENPPKIVFCFAIDTPPVTYSDGTTTVNGGIAAAEYGSSGGIIISQNKVKLKQSTVGDVVYNLNNSDCQYILIGLL